MADLCLAADDLAGTRQWIEACADSILPAHDLFVGEWADESHLSVYRGILARRRRLDSIAAARFGLARVAALQGDLAAARQHANGSLEIYRQSGHVLAKTVPAWFAEK